MNAILHHLRRAALLSEGMQVSDAQLLEAFLTRRDEAAFEAILRRHGPMVLAVCRRILRDPHDAEDAFQAVFLVLLRKAASVRSRELLGSWLYGVAYRTATKARAMNTKRRAREKTGQEPSPAVDPADAVWQELLEHLDVELNRLPDKYRMPVVLCELQGKSRKEAARLLGLPEGTVSWRLAQARKTLARKLSRYGRSLPAGALAGLMANAASASVPPALLRGLVQAARQVAAGGALTAGVVSAHVINLTDGVVKAMFLSKLKVVWLVAVAGFLSVGAAGWTFGAAESKPSNNPPPATNVARDEMEALWLEIEALRKLLHATRQRLETLEAEVQAIKTQTAGRADANPLLAEELKQEKVAWLMKEFAILYKQGKYDEARSAALKAQELDPKNAVADAAAYQAKMAKNKQSPGPSDIVADALAAAQRYWPDLRLEVIDVVNPVEVGGKTTYKIEVNNKGKVPVPKVEITAYVPKQMQVLSADGPTKPSIHGWIVAFPPVNSLPEKQSLTYSINVKALEPGDGRFLVGLSGPTLGPSPIIERKVTKINAPMPPK